jgi:hypothetical protein
VLNQFFPVFHLPHIPSSRLERRGEDGGNSDLLGGGGRVSPPAVFLARHQMHILRIKKTSSGVFPMKLTGVKTRLVQRGGQPHVRGYLHLCLSKICLFQLKFNVHFVKSIIFTYLVRNGLFLNTYTVYHLLYIC